jgi:hypothetical protein
LFGCFISREKQGMTRWNFWIFSSSEKESIKNSQKITTTKKTSFIAQKKEKKEGEKKISYLRIQLKLVRRSINHLIISSSPFDPFFVPFFLPPPEIKQHLANTLFTCSTICSLRWTLTSLSLPQSACRLSSLNCCRTKILLCVKILKCCNFSSSSSSQLCWDCKIT